MPVAHKRRVVSFFLLQPWPWSIGLAQWPWISLYMQDDYLLLIVRYSVFNIACKYMHTCMHFNNLFIWLFVQITDNFSHRCIIVIRVFMIHACMRHLTLLRISSFFSALISWITITSTKGMRPSSALPLSARFTVRVTIYSRGCERIIIMKSLEGDRNIYRPAGIRGSGACFDPLWSHCQGGQCPFPLPPFFRFFWPREGVYL